MKVVKVVQPDEEQTDLRRLAVLAALEELTWKTRLERALVRVTRWGVWTYVLALLIAFPVLQYECDRWWLATVMMFGPLWLVVVPLVLLAPMALILRARLLLPLMVVSLLYVFGPLGFCVPWPWHMAPSDSTEQLTVVTCNMQGPVGDRDALRRYLNSIEPDVIALQEMTAGHDQNALGDRHIARAGSLVIASHHPILESRSWKREEPPAKWPPLVALYAVIDGPSGPVGVLNVHLTTAHFGLAEVIDRQTLVQPSRSDRLTEVNYWRTRESELLAQWIGELPRVDIVTGDFNMPVQSHIYRQWWSGYRNAFSRAGRGFGHTRLATMYEIPWGVRIDHILTTDSWTAQRCAVGPHVGSDHRPVFAEIVGKRVGEPTTDRTNDTDEEEATTDSTDDTDKTAPLTPDT